MRRPVRERYVPSSATTYPQYPVPGSLVHTPAALTPDRTGRLCHSLPSRDSCRTRPEPYERAPLDTAAVLQQRGAAAGPYAARVTGTGSPPPQR